MYMYIYIHICVCVLCVICCVICCVTCAQADYSGLRLSASRSMTTTRTIALTPKKKKSEVSSDLLFPLRGCR